MDQQVTKIETSRIRMDGGTQPREALDHDAVQEYSEAMQHGAMFPPVVVFYDAEIYWLADGFHRVKAAVEAGLPEVDCDVHQGTQQDAQWYSFSANKTNGLRRTNEDKQRAVKAALLHPNGAGLSNSQIATHVGVDEGTVRNWRQKLIATSEIPKSEKRTGRDGRTIRTANIGKRKRGKRPASPSGRVRQGRAEPEETTGPDSSREGTEVEKRNAAETRTVAEAKTTLAGNPPPASTDLFRAWNVAVPAWDALVAAWKAAPDSDRRAFAAHYSRLTWVPEQPWLDAVVGLDVREEEA